MNFSKRLANTTLIVILTLVVLAVFAYPGGRGIAGDYRLVRSGKEYHLYDTAQPENQLGNSGAVVRIGWDSQRILVKRLASPARNTPWSNEAGWVVIDVARKKVSPTMTDTELRQRPEITHIVTYSPDSAYQRGHWW
jgi:membrane carboxypeptidase/penicillin-binding protein PbpC